jgi:hypothetical protein
MSRAGAVAIADVAHSVAQGNNSALEAVFAITANY